MACRIGAPLILAAAATIGVACSSNGDANDAGTPDDGGLDAGGADLAPAPTCLTPTAPQSCTAPQMTALPICKLSLTGCMDSQDITKFNSRAIYYEVNSPLWSDNAAKTRAFVLPAGGTIHVQN